MCRSVAWSRSGTGVSTRRSARPRCDRLLLETDGPYLAPVPHRGKRNEPAFVRHVAERIAEVRGISGRGADRARPARNAARVFGHIDPPVTPGATHSSPPLSSRPFRPTSRSPKPPSSGPSPDVAAELGLGPDEILPYGRHKAKITAEAIARRKPKGRLVLVTGINPTPAGEGKSTVTVGVSQALRRLGKKVVVCIREPSLGPVFGVKGGAAGGGYAQVVPMDEINLHFTGDFHAITSAHNLLSAHARQPPAPGQRPGARPAPHHLAAHHRHERPCARGRWSSASAGSTPARCAKSASSSCPAARSWRSSPSPPISPDLEARLGRIIVGLTRDRKPVTAGDLKASGAMTLLLKDAILPNLVQTLEGGPALVHCGPVRQHRPRLQFARRHPARACRSATSSSPRPASAPTSAPRNSSTSSAGSAGSIRRRR